MFAVTKDTLPPPAATELALGGSEGLPKVNDGVGSLMAEVKDAMSTAVEVAKEKTSGLTTQAEKVHP